MLEIGTKALAFTLLADPERKVIEAYDVWKEKKMLVEVEILCGAEKTLEL